MYFLKAKMSTSRELKVYIQDFFSHFICTCPIGHHVLSGGTNYLALLEVVNYHHPKTESAERDSEEN
jgi:hypothetical protein